MLSTGLKFLLNWNFLTLMFLNNLNFCYGPVLALLDAGLYLLYDLLKEKSYGQSRGVCQEILQFRSD